MGIPKKVIKFLEKSKVNYEILKHKKVFTAFDKSKTLKVSPAVVVKTVVLKIDKNFAFVLIPADKKVDIRKLKKFGKKIEIVPEKKIKLKFKGVKLGAIPPFGDLFKVQTFVDKSLFKKRELILNSGDWEHSIKIRPSFLKVLISNFVSGSFSK